MALSEQFLSEAMDCIGYCSEMIKYRRQMYRKMDNLTNLNNVLGPCTRFTTGGKAEGNARYFESDIDHMYIVKDVICTDVPRYFETNDKITLFKVEDIDTPPGYVHLKLLKHDGTCLKEEIAGSLFENVGGERYLSSSKFTENIKDSTIWLPGFTTQAKTGPSSPVSNGYLSIDRVVSLNCFLPKQTRSLFQRSHLLPRTDMTTNSDFSRNCCEVHAVPVGDRQSPGRYLEWRVCYTKVELYHIQSLSDKRLKVYILLKLLSRSKLKPLCNELTSYLVKNVVLWICIPTSFHFCRGENIFIILQSCLNFLRCCLIANNLPCFTNPKRNLLRGRVKFYDRERLRIELGAMLRLGPDVVFYCEKIRTTVLALQRIPQLCRAYSDYRDEIEKMMIILCECRARLRTPGVTQESYDALLLRDLIYRETKLKILAAIGLLSSSNSVKETDLQNIVDATKRRYYDRLYRMLS